KLLLEAGQAPPVTLFDPMTMVAFRGFAHESGMLALVVSSARQLESEGKLDEALDEYLTALKIVNDLSTTGPVGTTHRMWYTAAVMRRILDWAAKKEQPSERLLAAIARLHDLKVSGLRLDDAVQSRFVYLQRVIDGDKEARQFYLSNHTSGRVGTAVLWAT